MTLRELEIMISGGETTAVEFKSWKKCHDYKERKSLAVKSAVAMANAQGGTFLFGVEDDGTVTGCDNAYPQTLMESIYDMTRPNLFTDVESISTAQGMVLIVHVEKSNLPVATSAGVYYKRLGKTSKPFYPTAGTYSRQDLSDFSAKIIEGATKDDIDLMEVYKLKEKLRIRDKESQLPDASDLTFLENLELIHSESDDLQLTVAALLFAGKERSIRRLLPQAEIIYLHYSDAEQEEYDNRIDMCLPLVTMLDTLTDKIQTYNRITNVQVGLFRMEVYDFPDAVFQEALLNAMTHRSYECSGAVYVKHYPNRIIIENPGNFPEGITVDNIITHPSVPRNKLIAMTLQRLKYVQRSGQGVDIMFRSMILGGKQYPEYNVFSDSIKLTLHSNVEDRAFIKFIIEEQDKNGRLLGLSKLMILRYLNDNKRISLAQAAKTIQESKSTAKKELDALCTLGTVELSGREYMLTARVYEKLKKEVSYVQDKTLLYVKGKQNICDYLNKRGKITRDLVQDLCNYTQNQASYILRKMQTENIIESHGKSRSTYYSLK